MADILFPAAAVKDMAARQHMHALERRERDFQANRALAMHGAFEALVMVAYDYTAATQDAPANAASIAMKHLLLLAVVVKEIAHLAEIRTHDGLALGAPHDADGVAVDLVVRELLIVAEATDDPLLAALGAHLAVAAVVAAAGRRVVDSGDTRAHLDGNRERSSNPVLFRISAPRVSTEGPLIKSKMEGVLAAVDAATTARRRWLQILEAMIARLYAKPRTESTLKYAGGVIAAFFAIKYARSFTSAGLIGLFSGILAHSIYADVLKRSARSSPVRLPNSSVTAIADEENGDVDEEESATKYDPNGAH
ncbi:hypothetical protein FI667_g11294, partial [Globisporangium splendens]